MGPADERFGHLFRAMSEGAGMRLANVSEIRVEEPPEAGASQRGAGASTRSAGDGSRSLGGSQHGAGAGSHRGATGGLNALKSALRMGGAHAGEDSSQRGAKSMRFEVPSESGSSQLGRSRSMRRSYSSYAASMRRRSMSSVPGMSGKWSLSSRGATAGGPPSLPRRPPNLARKSLGANLARVSARTRLEEELEQGRPDAVQRGMKPMKSLARTSVGAVSRKPSLPRQARQAAPRLRHIPLSKSVASRDHTILQEYRESNIAIPAFADDQEFSSSGATQLCLPGYVIDNHSVWYIAWWWIIVGLTFWTAFYTPWYIAFEYSYWTLVPQGEDIVTYMPPLRGVAVDLVTAFFFVADIIVNFNLAFSENGLAVIDRKFIAHRYLTSTFAYDLIGAVPIGSFIIYITYWSFDISSRDVDAQKQDIETTVRYLYLLDLLCLARLHRIWQLARKMNLRRSELYLSVIMRNVIIACFWVHWGACLFFMICELDVNSECGLYANGFNMDTETDIGSWYLLSFYWAVITFSTVGYGDISPIGLAGQIYTIVFVLASLTVTAFLVGTITSALSIFDASLLERRTNQARLKQFAKSHHLSDTLCRELEKEFKVVDDVRSQGDEAALAGLPTTVRNSAIEYVYLPHLERCPLLANCGKQFLHMLLCSAHVEVFQKKSRILSRYDPVDELAIIAFGSVIVEYGLMNKDGPDEAEQSEESVIVGVAAAQTSRRAATVSDAPEDDDELLAPTIAGPSDIFGAISFFTDLPQPESVTVLSDLCHVIMIPRAAYMEAATHYPLDAYYILESLYDQVKLLMDQILASEVSSTFRQAADNALRALHSQSSLDSLVAASFRARDLETLKDGSMLEVKTQVLQTVCQLVIQKDFHKVQLEKHVAALLLHACARGSVRQVEELLSQERISGWNPVDAQDADGHTAVLIAAQRGHARLVRLLIRQGANIHLANRFGDTPLSAAVAEGHRQVCLILKEHGAKLQLPAWRSAALLCAAVVNADIEQLMLLLAAGAPPDAQYNLGGTALHVAAACGNTPAVRILVREWKADVFARDGQGRTPLDVARLLPGKSHAKHAQIVDILEGGRGGPGGSSARVRDGGIHVVFSRALSNASSEGGNHKSREASVTGIDT